jgi:ABC-type glycerol-3-phosphate transport system substrate-binding protein
MKKSKKVLSLVVCCFVVAGLFTGCNKKEEPVASPSAEVSTAPSAEASVAPSASAATDPSSFSGELTMWHFNKDEAPNIEKSFEATYKNVDLKVTVIPDKDQQYINNN